jgi:hypothetical protein
MLTVASSGLRMAVDDIIKAAASPNPLQQIKAVLQDYTNRFHALGMLVHEQDDDEVLLHASGTLTIYHITLSPGLQYPPHNHLMDALIGINKGGEMNFVYLRAMMAFGAVAVIALMLHGDLGAYLVAAGLFAHAAWDVCHIGRTRSWCAHWLNFASSWTPPWPSPLSSQPYEADQRRPARASRTAAPPAW